VAATSLGRARIHSKCERSWLSKTAISPSDERRRFERGHRGGQLREAEGQITPVAADEPHASGILVRQHPPAVDFLLEDPARAVEGALHFGRGHRRLDAGEGDSHR
jgi:hypothetical protein